MAKYLIRVLTVIDGVRNYESASYKMVDFPYEVYDEIVTIRSRWRNDYKNDKSVQVVAEDIDRKQLTGFLRDEGYCEYVFDINVNIGKANRIQFVIEAIDLDETNYFPTPEETYS